MEFIISASPFVWSAEASNERKCGDYKREGRCTWARARSLRCKARGGIIIRLAKKYPTLTSPQSSLQVLPKPFLRIFSLFSFDETPHVTLLVEHSTSNAVNLQTLWLHWLLSPKQYYSFFWEKKAKHGYSFVFPSLAYMYSDFDEYVLTGYEWILAIPKHLPPIARLSLLVSLDEYVDMDADNEVNRRSGCGT